MDNLTIFCGTSLAILVSFYFLKLYIMGKRNSQAFAEKCNIQNILTMSVENCLGIIDTSHKLTPHI